MLVANQSAVTNLLRTLKNVGLIEQNSWRFVRITKKGSALLEKVHKGAGVKGRGRKTTNRIYNGLETMDGEALLSCVHTLIFTFCPLVEKLGELVGPAVKKRKGMQRTPWLRNKAR